MTDEESLAEGSGGEESCLPAKSASQYADAINVISDIVDVAIDFIPGGSVGKKVIKYAPKVMRAAQAAAPVLDRHSDSINAAVGKVKDGAPDAVKAAAGAAKKGGSVIAGAVGKAFSAVSNPIRENIEESRDKKAQIEAHRAIIDHAAGNFTVEKFLDNQAEHEKLSASQGGSYMEYPGCFIFLVLGKGIKRDFADYKAVYVGASQDVGSGINNEIEGRGNPDVYADIKYDQNVRILFYPCAESELDRMKDSLIVALDADESYNS